MKIGFFILGKKGFIALSKFKERFGDTSVAFVVCARDSAIENDWFEENKLFCVANAIKFIERGQEADECILYDYAFAIGWRWIIKNSTNLIVFHDSILPKYRGFSPLVNMLINGESKLGVTALLANDDYDKGEIVYQEIINISYPLNIAQAIDVIVPLYAKLVVNTATDIFQNGTLKSVAQDESLASYSLWRDDDDYFIDWYSGSVEIKRFIDAVSFPYRGAATYLHKKFIRVINAEIVNDVIVENRMGFIGKIIFMDDGNPIVVCGRGLLKIVEVKSDDGTSLIGKIPFRSRFESRW